MKVADRCKNCGRPRVESKSGAMWCVACDCHIYTCSDKQTNHMKPAKVGFALTCSGGVR